MGHKFRYNNTTYSLFSSTSRITTPSLCHRENGTTYYVPLLTSRSQTIGSYTYSATSPTVCCRYNNITYYAAKSRVSVVYDIPAGTYTPSTFEDLIKKYISANGSRTCANAFTIKVNGHTYNVSAGQTIKYCTTNTAGSSTNSTLRIVTFNGSSTATASDAISSRFNGTYVVHASNFDGYATFSAYANYSITIGTGINFN